MTDETVIESVNTEDTVTLADLKKMISEQNAVILKQNESIKSLTARINDSEKTASATPVEQSQPTEPVMSPQDRAWESLMKELNIGKE